MEYLESFSPNFILLFLWVCVCRALVCEVNESDEYKVAYTITVDMNGTGNFTRIQQAIDSIPENNTKWIRIYILAGVYGEKVEINITKPCIFLEGAGSNVTTIEWGDHAETDTSATFTSNPDNIIAKGIKFKNTYNVPISLDQQNYTPALAARVYGDKSAFYDCCFVGFQDTLWDVMGRHYFKDCYIEGAVDFIFGAGQSIYESCEINVNIERIDPEANYGYITSQGRDSVDDRSGFVLKNCNITGTGKAKAYIGRPWRPYSTVIVADSYISDVVIPAGWDAGNCTVDTITYVEANNAGLGADKSGRVPWLKNLSDVQLNQFLSFSYIDDDGWIVLGCELNGSDEYEVAYTITVDVNGTGNFTRIQQAIDSIPEYNNKWIRIHISAGYYWEKVVIDYTKPCIFLKGAGSQKTVVDWDDHGEMNTSATFTSYPDKIVAKGISFVNSYKVPYSLNYTNYSPALAASIYGDKSAFYYCDFVGMQDTLWDAAGRHYFYKCYIEGAVDFIVGAAQSIYERCAINLNIGRNAPQYDIGYITAQGRNSPNDPGGFVFKYCTISGTGKAYLGRAWRPYSRVIVYESYLSNVVIPAGWDAWNFTNEDQDIEYLEYGNTGPGANTSGRVSWLKHLPPSQLNRLVNISYVDQEGWIANLPKN
ncbi:Pectinesterase domain-containing protein [Cephalotus follicularis]|uniref:Pectinesterase n=1 Tax=Cephalotus follicularis TaxID=3775 RepID=A0A1Q3CS46_CEPFO|nr:Pectinesterase domain-containing protein [Cephalotus follicularis]